MVFPPKIVGEAEEAAVLALVNSLACYFGASFPNPPRLVVLALPPNITFGVVWLPGGCPP